MARFVLLKEGEGAKGTWVRRMRSETIRAARFNPWSWTPATGEVEVTVFASASPGLAVLADGEIAWCELGEVYRRSYDLVHNVFWVPEGILGEVENLSANSGDSVSVFGTVGHGTQLLLWLDDTLQPGVPDLYAY